MSVPPSVCFRLKDAVKQVLHLQSSHTDSASHHSVLQDQMHKLSDKVSQATHFLGGGGRRCGTKLTISVMIIISHTCNSWFQVSS